jgi:hypothetical protein
MSQTDYYLVAVIFALFAGGWAVFKYLTVHIDKLGATMNAQHIMRMNAHEAHKTNVDARFEAAARRDAELSEKITASKYEQYKELQGYVTRAELDRRFDKQEKVQEQQSAKLDAVLSLLARLPN